MALKHYVFNLSNMFVMFWLVLQFRNTAYSGEQII